MEHQDTSSSDQDERVLKTLFYFRIYSLHHPRDGKILPPISVDEVHGYEPRLTLRELIGHLELQPLLDILKAEKVMDPSKQTLFMTADSGKLVELNTSRLFRDHIREVCLNKHGKVVYLYVGQSEWKPRRA